MKYLKSFNKSIDGVVDWVFTKNLFKLREDLKSNSGFNHKINRI